MRKLTRRGFVDLTARGLGSLAMAGGLTAVRSRELHALVGARDLGGSGVFLSDARVDELRRRVHERVEPTYTAWRALQREAVAAIDATPHAPEVWYVPGFYRDAEGHRSAKLGLQTDANSAYALALHHRVTGDAWSADAGVRLIRAWTTRVRLMRTEDDSRLSFSYHFPAFIFAADLLRRSQRFPAADQGAFAAFVREKALPMNTMEVRNNWGNWGLVLVLASAALLGDEVLFETGVRRWKSFIQEQIAPDGHLPHEVGRNEGRGERGLWYSHFTLMPQTLAAEIARVQGLSLYDHRSPNGRSLQAAFERLSPWTLRPETFPYYRGAPGGQLGTDYVSYFEILNALWPNAAATELLKRGRPFSATHSAPHLTFTHGEPL